MIELPRAALRAGEIAQSAEFFSFGTNDLTQTTLGVSRDDAASFLGNYTVKGLLQTDPFVTSIPKASANSSRSPPSADARPARTLSLASAANTTATRRRSRSARAWGSTTSRAPPSASRSPGSPPRRPRWGGRRQAGVRRRSLLRDSRLAHAFENALPSGDRVWKLGQSAGGHRTVTRITAHK